MTDREKVIKGLEVCIPLDEGEDCPKECPYYQDVCLGYSQVMRDALALLKEHEAVQPRVSTVEQRCGNCNKIIEMDGWKACPWCGKQIDWESWWSVNGRNNGNNTQTN